MSAANKSGSDTIATRQAFTHLRALLLVRVLGGAEMAAGAGALLVGGPVAATAVGLLYTAFALVVLRALLAGAESCGCFGRLDAPPSLIHVLANLMLAAASLAAAGAENPAIPAVVEAFVASPAVGVALAVEIVVLAGLAMVTLTALPEALKAGAARSDSIGLFRSVPPSDAGRAAASGWGGPR